MKKNKYKNNMSNDLYIELYTTIEIMVESDLLQRNLKE